MSAANFSPVIRAFGRYKVLNQNTGAHQRLAEVYDGLEREITSRLKEQEHLSIQLQNQIDAASDEIENLLSAIAEGEEQVLLWERKITLAQDMKNQLNPKEGLSELDSMKAEIHRMQVRMTQARGN